jgi:hypothetical protein
VLSDSSPAYVCGTGAMEIADEPTDTAVAAADVYASVVSVAPVSLASLGEYAKATLEPVAASAVVVAEAAALSEA